jgi:hypothetical protein
MQVIDTTSEMIAGYVAVALLVGGYVLSLWTRGRRVRQRLATIERRQDRAAGVSSPTTSDRS